MPLVILTGWPLTGKTTFAHSLKSALSSEFADIEIINDEALGISKPTTTLDIATEKKNRAALLAAVERRVTKERLVIADSTNEIKGFRYQLYCISRMATTAHVCVQVLATRDDIEKRNTGYSQAFIADLISRYEEPSNAARWDSPLFYVPPDGHFLNTAELKSVLKGSPMKQPSLATRKAEIPADYVQELEAACRRVVDHVQLQMTNSALRFTINGYAVQLQRKLNGPELQRLKRQFIQMNRQTACPIGDIERLFVDYLNKYSE